MFSFLRVAKTTVESWRTAKIDVPFVGGIPVNFVDLLKLQPLLDWLRDADALGFFGVLLFTFAFAFLVGLFVALNLFLLGLIFNAVSKVAGGIGVEVRESNQSSVISDQYE